MNSSCRSLIALMTLICLFNFKAEGAWPGRCQQIFAKSSTLEKMTRDLEMRLQQTEGTVPSRNQVGLFLNRLAMRNGIFRDRIFFQSVEAALNSLNLDAKQVMLHVAKLDSKDFTASHNDELLASLLDSIWTEIYQRNKKTEVSTALSFIDSHAEIKFEVKELIFASLRAVLMSVASQRQTEREVLAERETALNSLRLSDTGLNAINAGIWGLSFIGLVATPFTHIALGAGVTAFLQEITLVSTLLWSTVEFGNIQANQSRLQILMQNVHTRFQAAHNLTLNGTLSAVGNAINFTDRMITKSQLMLIQSIYLQRYFLMKGLEQQSFRPDPSVAIEDLSPSAIANLNQDELGILNATLESVLQGRAALDEAFMEPANLAWFGQLKLIGLTKGRVASLDQDGIEGMRMRFIAKSVTANYYIKAQEQEIAALNASLRKIRSALARGVSADKLALLQERAEQLNAVITQYTSLHLIEVRYIESLETCIALLRNAMQRLQTDPAQFSDELLAAFGRLVGPQDELESDII